MFGGSYCIELRREFKLLKREEISWIISLPSSHRGSTETVCLNNNEFSVGITRF